jgi:hypothetical protein
MGMHELPLSVGRTITLRRVAISAYTARLQLAAVITLSFVLRSIAALGHVSPRYFPDEYIYSSLARSIAEGKGLQIRGGAAHFPALLEPLLSSPFWLSGDAATAYRLTLVWHAFAISLAAVPVFLLCRRLGVTERAAVMAGAFAVALPSLTWASYLTADAIAYPLALTAFWAVIALLDRPSRRLQVLLPLLCGAAALARVQYIVIPVVFILAALVLEHGRVVAVARRYPLTLAIFCAPVVVIGAAGPSKILGYYSAVTSLGLNLGALARWGAVDVALLAVASGVVLVPGAVGGLVAGLVKPRTRVEAAFAVSFLLFALALLFEAALYASNGSARFQERYLMALTPLLAPAFALGAQRLTSLRRAGFLAAAGLVLFTARVPISGYTIGDGKQDSPFLAGIYQLQQWTTGTTGALVVSAAGAVLALLGVAALLRPRRGVAVALTVACLIGVGGSYASTVFDHQASLRARVTYSPGDKQWVDHAHVGPTDELVLPYTPRAVTPVHFFWNTSLRNVVLFSQADAPDIFRQFKARIAPDGRLLEDGSPSRRPLLVEEYLGKAALQDATAVRSNLMSTLWRPNGDVRFSWLARGRYFDGWLASRSSVTVWPDGSGWTVGTLKLRFYLPADAKTGSVRLSGPGVERVVQITRGGRQTVAVPVDASGPWTVQLRATGLRFLADGRDVSVRSFPPLFQRAPLKPALPSADRG